MYKQNKEKIDGIYPTPVFSNISKYHLWELMKAGNFFSLVRYLTRERSWYKPCFQAWIPGGTLLKIFPFLCIQMFQHPIITMSMAIGAGKHYLRKKIGSVLNVSIIFVQLWYFHQLCFLTSSLHLKIHASRSKQSTTARKKNEEQYHLLWSSLVAPMPMNWTTPREWIDS